jgi:hypothetical protein
MTVNLHVTIQWQLNPLPSIARRCYQWDIAIVDVNLSIH